MTDCRRRNYWRITFLEFARPRTSAFVPYPVEQFGGGCRARPAGLDIRPAFPSDALAQVPLEFAHVVNRDPPQASA